jgi:hypothetical protein
LPQIVGDAAGIAQEPFAASEPDAIETAQNANDKSAQTLQKACMIAPSKKIWC